MIAIRWQRMRRYPAIAIADSGSDSEVTPSKRHNLDRPPLQSLACPHDTDYKNDHSTKLLP